MQFSLFCEQQLYRTGAKFKFTSKICYRTSKQIDLVKNKETSKVAGR